MANPIASFMGVPTETRLEVYRYLLCTSNNKCMSSRLVTTRRHLYPEVLRTCQQVYAEAKDVLYRENVFMQVSFNSHIFESMLRHHGVFSLAGPTNNGLLWGHSFGVVIAFDVSVSSGPCYMMIGSEDIQRLCDVMWIFSATEAHIRSVHIHIFYPTLAQAIPGGPERKFLQPFTHHWQVPNIVIICHGEADFICSFEAPARRMDLPTPEAEFTYTQAWRRTGDMHEKRGQYVKSAVAYSKATYIAYKLNQHPAFVHGAVVHPDSLWCRLAAENFHLLSGLSYILLKLGQREHSFQVSNVADYYVELKFRFPDIPLSTDDIMLATRRMRTLLS